MLYELWLKLIIFVLLHCLSLTKLWFLSPRHTYVRTWQYRYCTWGQGILPDITAVFRGAEANVTCLSAAIKHFCAYVLTFHILVTVKETDVGKTRWRDGASVHRTITMCVLIFRSKEHETGSNISCMELVTRRNFTWILPSFVNLVSRNMPQKLPQSIPPTLFSHSKVVVDTASSFGGFFNESVSTIFKLYSVEWYHDWWTGKDLERSGLA